MFALRLGLDTLAGALLLFCLAYWWLGNWPHELAGTVMFLLIIAHNVFNRRWYGAVGRTSPRPRNLFNIGLTVALLLAMSTLVVTSVLISNALAGWWPIQSGFTAKRIHALVGYWALVIVAIHLGLRWPMLMAYASNRLKLSGPNAARTSLLRGIALVLSACGTWSFFELGLDKKLTMQMTLDWWDFEESVIGFFARCLAVAALITATTHYVVLLGGRGMARLLREDHGRGRRSFVPRSSDRTP